MKKILAYCISIIACLALAMVIVFIHYESDNIQLALTEMGHLNFDSAPYFVRIFVGFCWALCLFAVLPTMYRKWALIRVAIVSTLILLYILLIHFTQPHLMPIYFSSIHYLFFLLPTIMAVVFALLGLYLFQVVIWQKINKMMTVILFILLIASGITASFLMNPVAQKIKAKTIPADLLKALGEANATTPSVDFSKGKHIICIMSYTCPHCKTAAKKFRVLQQLHPTWPVKVILGGKENKRVVFFAKTGMQQVPNYLLNNDGIFWQIAQNSIPAIYLVNNGKVEKRIHHSNISEKELSNWLAQ